MYIINKSDTDLMLNSDYIQMKGDSGVFPSPHEPKINKKDASYT
jgi:hypothetical protein